MAKKFYMETTQKSVPQTVAEIEDLFCRHRVTQVVKRFDEDGEVTGVWFLWRHPAGDELPFALPFRWEPIFNEFRARRKRTRGTDEKDEAQARRVAARQVLRWVEAQLALIDCEMAQFHEVFMPYLCNGTGEKTLFEHHDARGWARALPEGRG